ncbi:hypothetical protein M3O96_15060 [Aquiflexum sp. TKW24L]|uniref:hypothetical protein n=1 Tax=Aquiflexum sp. TKW24L TaxID=2942212 RepID=UPI0020C1823F|nr:hypothetical protein [Aquiflexum sp. TKW24L]MCL6260420.1 hypothetical protein [Aquiflexum sp. TKW24L]
MKKLNLKMLASDEVLQKRQVIRNWRVILFKIMFISIFWTCFSCGKKTDPETDVKEVSYFFEKVDSIRIERENTIRILDFNSATQRFLAVDNITQEFLILDEKGQILKSIFNKGEGPNEYNTSLIAASFNQEGEGIFALSSTEFLWFNEDWDIIERRKFASQRVIKVYGGPKTKVPYFRLFEGKIPHFFTSFFSRINHFAGGEEDEIFSEYLIEMYDPKKQSLDWVFRNDPKVIPSYELNDDKRKTYPVQIYSIDTETKFMYLTFERSNEIGVYDLAKDFQPVEKMNFQHKNFPATQKAKNNEVILFSPDLIGLFYFEGLSEAATEIRKAENPDYFPFRDPLLYKFIVLKNGLQQRAEIDFPQTCEPHSEMVIMDDNQILLRDKYTGNDEPTYSTYSVFELKQSFLP